MGITQVTATVRNPADPEKTWEGLFLVDAKAIDCLVPRPCLEAIGLTPKGERVYGLADGSDVRMEVTPAISSSWERSSGPPSCLETRTPSRCWA